MSKKFLVKAMLAGTIILIVLAIITVLPLYGSKTNGMDYVSTCPFAPWSTLMLLLTAGLLWIVRGYILTRVD